MPRTFKPFIPQKMMGYPELKNNDPIDLEIGCGVGLHPIKYASSNRSRNLIAIEHTAAKYSKFMGRLQNHPDLDNIYPIHANATSWTAEHLNPQQISKIFILYPNPWPKPKHKNKRWAAMPYMQHLFEVLKPGGELTIASNFEWYIQQTIADMPVWGFEKKLTETFTQKDVNSIIKSSNIHLPRTHFEKKYLESGQKCFQAIFKKKD